MTDELSTTRHDIESSESTASESTASESTASECTFKSNICAAYTKNNRRCCVSIDTGDKLCKRHSKMTFDTCSICFDNMYTPTTLACNHAFCTNCIYRWSSKGDMCPMCRKKMFFIIHSKDVKIRRAEELLLASDYWLDPSIRSRYGFNEDLLCETITFFLENEWLVSSDRRYKDILRDYINYWGPFEGTISKRLRSLKRCTDLIIFS